MLFGGLAADLGIGSGAEAARELAADVELHVRVGQQQRLRVGVDGDELDALEAGVDHAVDRVAATAADADDLDHREIVLRSAEHGLPSRLPVSVLPVRMLLLASMPPGVDLVDVLAGRTPNRKLSTSSLG